ncbi:hypothetical protein [Mycoplasmopsis glycophila]|uniref:Uncharacterized protein n=1 Tax=Mycoplasmopsis glycophila TaxID=171285 RepID=A0A449AVT4_9BACT|nr:hypothetical protein [Mycoplasmopsis glycophila]VEU70702.1 Uncharacterised protein [Mycoplasmopsis glycophila]
MSEISQNKIDLIELRKQEIKHAILLAQNDQEKQVYEAKQKELVWYKKELFLNILGALGAIFLIVILFVVSFVISKI